MPEASPLFLVVAFLGGMLGAVAAVAGSRNRSAPPSLALIVVAVLPGAVLIVLYYSLAIHMHESLGGWPRTIGSVNFPTSLARHATVVGWWFSLVVLVVVLPWPVVVGASMLGQRWRGAALYLGVFGLSVCACFGLMLLAPEPFRHWWWD